MPTGLYADCPSPLCGPPLHALPLSSGWASLACPPPLLRVGLPQSSLTLYICAHAEHLTHALAAPHRYQLVRRVGGGLQEWGHRHPGAWPRVSPVRPHCQSRLPPHLCHRGGEPNGCGVELGHPKGGVPQLTWYQKSVLHRALMLLHGPSIMSNKPWAAQHACGLLRMHVQAFLASSRVACNMP